MAEARVWNIARTADEIKQNLYQSLSGDESGLVGYWPLRENYEDYSTFTANGTAYGETNIQIENNRFALYSVPQPYYTLAPGGTEIIPITFYNRDDAGSLFFTTNLYSDDPVEELVTLEVALQFGETVPATPVHFVPVAESNLPYTIYITDAQIDQQTLDVGDEVGVFDGELCVGAGIFNGDFNFIITAWQDNPGQGLAGFTPGNNMVFKMYDTSADLETNEAEEHYQIGDDTFGLGSFSAVALEASVYNIQNLSITGGQFNLVSFNLLPHYPNADNVFGDLESLQIAYNDDGDVFIPGYNINTIGDINFLDGFYLYTDENTNMEFEGTYIHQEDWQINVEPAKWNYISVLSQDPVAVVDVFTGLEDEVSIVQAASGDSWIPSLGVNTIGNLQPGLGYKIALAVDTMVTFNYPAASKKSSEMPQLASNKPDNTRQNTYFESTPSGLPYAVVVKVKRINEMNHELQLNIGDELGLFAGETCVGSGTFDGTNPMLITAWEMDESQNLPGFSSGQLMYARVYRPSLEKVTRHKLVSEFGSQPRFGLGNFANTTLDLLPYNSNPATFTMAPNPFKSSTDVIIQLNSEEAVDVKIFDPSGRLVKILGNQSSTSAYHKLNWDGTDLKGRKLNPGVYFVIAETSAEVFTEKVIILQ
jgi:hypothetical protein